MKFDIHTIWSLKTSKGFVIGLIALFSLLTVGEYLKWFFMPSLLQTASPVESLTVPMDKKDSFIDLFNSSLFGVYIPNDLNQIKQSMLNITLAGILLGAHSADSQVIIRSAEGDEKNYKINDLIPGDVLIKKIMADGILVEHNGSLERINLPEDELTFDPVATPLRND